VFESKGFAFLESDGTIFLKITFGGNNNLCDFLWGMIVDLCNPAVDTLKGSRIIYGIGKNNS
jgi:hypothetical protein